MEWTAWLSVHLLQDKYDDMLIGVKSTALKFGDNTKLWLTGFGTTMVSLLVLTGRMCDQTWPYYSAVSLTAAHIAHQVGTVSSKTHGGQLLVHLISLTTCSFYDRFVIFTGAKISFTLFLWLVFWMLYCPPLSIIKIFRSLINWYNN